MNCFFYYLQKEIGLKFYKLKISQIEKKINGKFSMESVIGKVENFQRVPIITQTFVFRMKWNLIARQANK